MESATTARTGSQPHHRAGLLAGLIAGVLLTAVMFVLNRTVGAFSLPELVAYQVIALMPLPVFSFFVSTFGSGAKGLLLLAVTAGQLLVATGLGVLWASTVSTLPGEARPGRRLPVKWRPDVGGGLTFAFVLFLLVGGGVLPLVGGGLFGAALLGGWLATVVAATVYAVLYGLTLALLYRRLLAPALGREPGRAGPPVTRREVLRRLGLGFAALVVAGGALGGLNRRGSGGGVVAGARGRVGDGDLPPDPTPNESFYTISKNFADPKVGEEDWRLEIGGLVERPYALTLAEIRAMPAVADYRTLCCISNEVGGDLISNAAWRGVRLKDLLERAGVKPGAVDLTLTARDGYTESFPIAKALDPDVLAVYEMNGVTLPDSHGFPLRLLVPDIYGMKNVKWVTKLEVVGSDFKGFWQGQGWSDEAIVKTMSRFDFPRARQVLPSGQVRVGGVAFAGARGVAKVEVTADGGGTWTEGRLRRPLGPYTWVLWTADLDLPDGDHTLEVRAVDGRGALQPARREPPLPDGSAGWHTIAIRTAAGIATTPGR